MKTRDPAAVPSDRCRWANTMVVRLASGPALSSPGSSTTYAATITFQYEVNGRTCSTETLHFGQTAGSGYLAPGAGAAFFLFGVAVFLVVSRL